MNQPTKGNVTERRLKIEAEGDAWKSAFKPKIRLIGRWLEKAGFKPDTHVNVRCLSPGIIELRSESTNSQQLSPKGPNQTPGVAT
jgi:hypothetical protein